MLGQSAFVVQAALFPEHLPLPATFGQSADVAQTLVVAWQYFRPVQSEFVVHCFEVCVLHLP